MNQRPVTSPQRNFSLTNSMALLACPVNYTKRQQTRQHHAKLHSSASFALRLGKIIRTTIGLGSPSVTALVNNNYHCEH